jgi:hypothetical protein
MPGKWAVPKRLQRAWINGGMGIFTSGLEPGEAPRGDNLHRGEAKKIFAAKDV